MHESTLSTQVQSQANQETDASNTGYSLYLDIIRIIAIIAIVILHAGVNAVNNVLPGDMHWIISSYIDAATRFAVPVFIMLSGALILSKYQEGEIESFYKNILFKLVLPLIAWEIIYRYWFCSIVVWPSGCDVFSTPGSFHLWFIYMIIGIYLTAPFLGLIAKKMTLKLAIYFIIIWLLFNIINDKHAFFIDWNMPNTLYPVYKFGFFNVTIGYFIIGYILHTFVNLNNRLIILGISGAVFILSVIGTGYVAINIITSQNLSSPVQ